MFNLPHAKTNPQRKYAHSQYDVFHCSHHFLKVYYGSEVNGQVDFIEGDSAMRSFSAGYYSDQGMSVSEMEVTTKTLSVRPRKPFGVSTEFWSK